MQTILPAYRINAGVTMLVAQAIVHSKLRPGVVFIVKRREGRDKQIEENLVTRVTDLDVEYQQNVFDKVGDGKRELVHTATIILSLDKFAQKMRSGLVKVVRWPGHEDMPSALVEILIQEEEDKRKKKREKVDPRTPKRGMRVVSRAKRRARAGLSRRIHIKKHEQRDPMFGSSRPKG